MLKQSPSPTLGARFKLSPFTFDSKPYNPFLIPILVYEFFKEFAAASEAAATRAKYAPLQEDFSKLRAALDSWDPSFKLAKEWKYRLDPIKSRL